MLEIDLRICPNCFSVCPWLWDLIDTLYVSMEYRRAIDTAHKEWDFLGEIYVKQFTPVFEIGLLSSERWKSERLLLIWFICLFRTSV